LLNKIAADAELDETATGAIMKASLKKTAAYKEAKLLPGNFDLHFDNATAPSEFSLGKHSLSKVAEDEYVVKAKHLPDRTTYEDLVQVAREIRAELDKKDGPVEVKVVK
jgi:hypothetical protein